MLPSKVGEGSVVNSSGPEPGHKIQFSSSQLQVRVPPARQGALSALNMPFSVRLIENEFLCYLFSPGLKAVSHRCISTTFLRG